MDGRPTWTDCDEAGDYVVPNVLSPRDLVSRPDIMDETVPHTHSKPCDKTLTVSHLSLVVRKPVRAFRPGPTQTGLYSHKRWLEASDLGSRGIVLSM